MAINLDISDNRESIPLSVQSNTRLRSVNADNGSPYYVGARAYVTQNVDGATVTVIDKDGTTTANIYNGTDGADGQDGADGNGITDISLTSTVGNVDTYTITYDDGTTETFDVTNGIDGQDGADGADGRDGVDGQNGQDGISPTATVTKAGDTATISITDKDGTTTATVTDGTDGRDGTDGTDGQDGYSPSATVTKSGTVATITITDKDGTTTAEVYDGSGSISDVKVDGTSVVTGGVAEIDLTGKSDVGHTHTKSAITDFPILAAVATSGDYDDLTDKPTIPSNVSDLVNDSGFITSPNVVYCTCSTAAGTAAKVATVESGSLASLHEGDQAIVKFTNANSVASPTLKIGTTDAKSIKRYGTTAPSTSAATSWNAGSAIMFVYDGNYWQMIGFLNSTYSEISAANITSGSGSTTGLVSGRRAKAAVEAFAPVQSVNGSTGAVTIAVPTDLSDLNNDMVVSDFTNDAGYLTAHQDISGKSDKTDTDIHSDVITLFTSLGWTAT